jgi:hypothetical protein
MSSWDDFPEESEPDEDLDPSTVDGLLALLEAQAALLVDVATGGSQIDRVNHRYKRRRRALNEGLRARGLAAPFPFEDLWAWRGDWKSREIGTYQGRRDRIAELGRPTRHALEAALAGIQVEDPGGVPDPTWADLDQRLAGVVLELGTAATHDDLQDVGRRCREILIDAARLLADPSLVPDGADAPKAADAKGWLDLFLVRYAQGRTHRELRAFVPVAWDLAQKVTHGDIERVDAFAAAQATVLVVRVLQQLAPLRPGRF